MQRFLNDPDNVVDEAIAGFVRAHADMVRLDPANSRVVIARSSPQPGRVGIVTGGGSGHEPAFIGYCGKNMVDAVAVGELFDRPRPKAFTMRSGPPTAVLAWRCFTAITPATI